MFVYFAKSCSSVVSGKQLNPVTCEKCGAAFHYELARSAVGTATAPYGMNMPAAQERAEKSARVKLRNRLSREVELVPCPNCRWVNLDLIARYRKSVARGWNIIHLLILFVALLTLGIMALAADDLLGHPFRWRDTPVALLILFTACALVISICIQQYVRLRVNPNVHRNGLPDVPPGTPPALVYQTLPTGEIIQVAIASDYANLRTDAAWATYRPGQLVFEPVCCVCLASAVMPLKLPFADAIGARICFDCNHNLWRMFWLWSVLLSIPVILFTAWFLAHNSDSSGGQGVVAILFAVSTIGIIFYLTALAIRPYRRGVVDRNRNIRRIRFRNPAYTALLKRRIGQSDGLYAPEDATR